MLVPNCPTLLASRDTSIYNSVCWFVSPRHLGEVLPKLYILDLRTSCFHKWLSLNFNGKSDLPVVGEPSTGMRLTVQSEI